MFCPTAADEAWVWLFAKSSTEGISFLPSLWLFWAVCSSVPAHITFQWNSGKRTMRKLSVARKNAVCESRQKASLCLSGFWNICWKEHENCFLLATTGRFVFIITYSPSWAAALSGNQNLLVVAASAASLPIPRYFKSKGSILPQITVRQEMKNRAISVISLVRSSDSSCGVCSLCSYFAC